MAESTQRGIFEDARLRPVVVFETLHSPVGLPPVYIAPADRPDVNCEVGSSEEFCRVTRAELLEWAEAIIRTVHTS